MLEALRRITQLPKRIGGGGFEVADQAAAIARAAVRRRRACVEVST